MEHGLFCPAMLPESLLTEHRWPKMTEIETGVSSPGGINGLLMWQQVSGSYTILNQSNRAAPSYVPCDIGLPSLANTQDS
jgi:hypothetical protein